MKKIILLLLLCFPITVFADVDYDIDHYLIEAQIKENGDMDVAEAIYLNGEFNGYERDIVYASLSSDDLYNAKGITNIQVFGTYTDDADFNIFQKEYSSFSETLSAYNGESNKYILTDLNYGYRLRMYMPADNETVAFIIKYTVDDAAILHNDVAELNWNFIGWDYEDDINDLQVKVHLPKADDSDYFRIWASSQTNLSGEINKLNNQEVLATTERLDAYDPLTVRLTFNPELLDANLVQKQSGEDKFAEILAEEQTKADEANALRKTIKQKYYGVMGATIIFYITLIAVWIYTYIKYDKERKPQFNLKYNREFIDDYNVEVVDYLMHKNITNNALSASIMNLIYKKNIKLEEIPDLKKKEYRFILVNRDNLNETENLLVDFLFNKVGKDNAFTTAELKKYASGTKTCSSFLNTYTSWKNAVIADGEKEEFFEKKPVVMPVVMLFAAIFVSALAGLLNVEAIFCYTPIFGAIAFLVYSLIFTKKTAKGIEHYAKWTAFKNFLNDFGTFELKELPEIALWDRYLVYATIFGLADKVEKAMSVHIKEIGVDDYVYNSIFIYNNINIAPVLDTAFTSAINNAQAAVNRANAASSMSSGSGFGGGFSSGGGFGGGGGGGRGF